jgi:hypothetical protein
MKTALWSLALFALAQPPAWPLADARLSLQGLGAVRIGMRSDAVGKAAQAELAERPSGSEGCVQSYVRRDPGIVFMFEKDILTRVDFADPHHATLRGVRIGDAESRARELYKGEFEERPHKYVADGRYLIVRSADRRYALVMETDGRFVTRLRAGAMPSVEYVEGCS